MAFTTFARNAIADDGVGANFNAVGLLNDVGTPISGALQSCSFGAASSGQVNLSSNVVFNINSGTTVGSVRFYYFNGSTYEPLDDIDITNYNYTENGTFTLKTGTYYLVNA